MPLQIGDTAALTKTITDDDIRAFAALTGDTNPVHLDDEYAKTTRFGRRIAHGMICASLFSAVLSNQLPAPARSISVKTCNLPRPFSQAIPSRPASR